MKTDQEVLNDTIIVAAGLIAEAIRDLAAAVEKPTSYAGANKIVAILVEVVNAIDFLSEKVAEHE